MATASASWPNPPLDRSILGWDPTDEFSVLIGDWLSENGQGYSNLEIEAKVGRIIDQSTGQRVQIPVRTETIIEMQRGWKFESHMSDAQHQKINGLLNKAVEQSSGKITYQRQKEVDLFYSDENKEDDRRTEPLNQESDFQRSKNRLHYTHQQICVDLTQVSSPGGDEKPTNELELEFKDANVLLQSAQASVHAASRQEWTPFYDSILIFLNNIRMLIRNAD
ncbi:hypothetical protein L7F22_019054 [Adiantum nelumboides]|nr:hypothetical protein [Adiantum nelumboides]